MNRNKMTKVFSAALSLALIATSAPMPAGAIGPVASAPAFVTRLTPPEQFGYVASSFAPKGEEKPRLIIMSDLHAHLEVQRNIMGMLGDLVSKLKGSSDKKVPVFLEGGWEENLQEPLQKISNSQSRHFLNEYYLQKAELGGPQAFSEQIAGTNQITMTGVEDKEEYLANKARFAKTYPVRRQLLEALKIQETAMHLLSDAIEGSSFRKMQSMRDGYNAGRLTPERYAKALLRYTNRFHIQNKYVSVLEHTSTANQNDLDGAFAHTYREVSVKLSDKRPMTAFLREQLGNEAVVRQNLARVDADLDLLKRLIADQLTPSEVSIAMSRIGQLIQTAEKLVENQPVAVDVRKVIHESLDFYPLAFLRDETLVKNSLAHLDKMGSETTGILVAGGFHTDAIASYLRDHQIAYMVINPSITRDLTSEEQLNYVKRMCGDHVTAQELQSDLEWIQTGRRKAMDAISAGTSPTATNQGTKLPGSEGTQDKLFNGLKDSARNAVTNGGDQLTALLQKLGMKAGIDDATVMRPDNALAPEALQAAQALINQNAGQNAAGSLQLNANLPGLTLKLKDGRYVAANVNNGKVFGEIADAALAMSPHGTALPTTLHIASVEDVTALKTLGNEGNMIINGDEAVMPIALSRFLSLKAMDENKPKAGSPEEANMSRAIHLVAHEMTHIALRGASENATAVHGLSLGAMVAAQHFQEGGVARYAEAVTPQLEVGKSIPSTSVAGLASRIASLVSPKDLQVKTVAKLANELATEFPELDAKQIEAELTGLQGSMEMNAALFGYSDALKKRVVNKIRTVAVMGSNA